MGTTELMGNKLRVEAEKKKSMCVHGSVVFLKTDSCSAGEEKRFQRNLQTLLQSAEQRAPSNLEATSNTAPIV
jgi:hypothetical protein